MEENLFNIEAAIDASLTRKDQDEFALNSQNKTIKAMDSKKFID